MGVERLTQLLRESADRVPVPDLAPAAWTRAARIRRRRRRVTVAAAAVASVLAIAVALPLGLRPVDRAPVAPTPAVTAPANVIDRMPSPLPARDIGLPRTPELRTDAEDLSDRPVTRAVALYERATGGSSPGDVYVLGSDGAIRRLDTVRLGYATDALKAPRLPLQPTSLSPDGRSAAFPQLDKLVVVDLTTAKTDAIPVPGFNMTVRWRSAGAVLVGQPGGTYLVDLRRRVASALPADLSPLDVVGDEPLLELGTGALREWTVTGARPLDQTDLDSRAVAPYVMSRWSGPAWQRGDLVARAAVSGGGEGLVAVVDLRTAAVVRLLVLGARADQVDGTALGWLDARTVLLRTGRDGVVAWNVSTGSLSTVATAFDGAVAIASR